LKKAWLAFILSLLLPGLGHFYLGRTTKGSVLIGIALFIPLLTSIVGGWAYIFFMVAVYAIVDSYNLTEVVNKELKIAQRYIRFAHMKAQHRFN
jgi:TM2 domain-containing membrane protein YozV